MESNYLSIFFKLIANVTCDKAKEHAEKGKIGALPSAVQSALIHFSQCEKNYFSLAFLEQKWFGRKDPLKNAYLTLHCDLKTIAKLESRSAEGTGQALVGTGYVIPVCENLANFCLARADCVDLYELCLRSISMKELAKSLNEITQKHIDKFQHPLFQAIHDSFVTEFETFKCLVSTSVLISEYSYFSSLISLHKIHRTLQTWQPLVTKDSHHSYSFRSGIFGFGEKHSLSVSALYQWMIKYYQSLVSKFSFYFYKLLSSQTKPEEIKALLSKTNYDYISRTLLFCKKTDPAYVLLASASNELGEKPDDAPGYKAVLELPGSISEQLHWSVINMLLRDRADDLSSEKIVHFHDKSQDFTYYIAHADLGIALVVVVSGTRKEKDSYIVGYINEIVTNTRPKRVFSLLRPGSK